MTWVQETVSATMLRLSNRYTAPPLWAAKSLRHNVCCFQPAETDDDKIRRLSTAERLDQELDQEPEHPSSSLEIPGALDSDSSAATEHPEADILIIDHPEAGDHGNVTEVRDLRNNEKIRPSSAEVLLSTT